MRQAIIGLYSWGDRFTFRLKDSRVHNTFSTFTDEYATTADAFCAWLQREGYNAGLAEIEDSFHRIDFKDEDGWTLFRLRWT